MSRILVQTLDSVPEQTRATLEKLARRSGKLFNIHAEMAHAPVVPAAYAGLSDALVKRGSFGARTREAIAHLAGNLFTSFFNHYARTDLDVALAPELSTP